VKRLKVLILCGRSPRHLHFANAICAAAEVVGIVHEIGAHWSREKIRKTLRPRVFFPKAWRWLRDRRRYLGEREARFFFTDGRARLDQPHLVHSFPNINDPGVVELAERLAPDLIAVFGTSLIKGPLLTRGRLGLVNLHGGLSPEYRGADCTFWALHNGEPHKVGCTIHFIDQGIDTGRLIAHVCPEVMPGDDELALFWRSVRDSAQAYAELIRRMEAGERFGQGQSTKGRLYQVRDRLLRHERHLARELPGGIPSHLSLQARLTWFPADAGAQESIQDA
jgi:methionyl-tRNA formyltransferase